MKFRVILLSLMLAVGASGWSGCAQKVAATDPDQLVLIELKKGGSDLSKPHKIDFYVSFPTQPVAEQAAVRIRDLGFQVKVEKSTKGDNWLCLSTKTMVPDLSAIKKVGHDFETLAAPLKGNYDGWETGVEK